MYSVAVIKPGTLELVDIPIPAMGPYDVLVKTEVSFLCNLTDRKVIEGHMPGVGIEQYPVLLGHESAGVAVEVGGRVESFQEGDRIVGGLLLHPPAGSSYGSAWGGFSEYLIVKDHAAMLRDGVADNEHGWDEVYKVMLKVPEDVPPEAAAMLCTWREVYSALFCDFRLNREQRIMVFGAGPVGLSFVQFASLCGFEHVVSVDPNEGKRQKATELGATIVFGRDDPDLDRLCEDTSWTVDAVIDAVGKSEVINRGLRLIGMDGRICVYGVLADPTLDLSVGDAPYNFNLLVHQWPSRDAEAAAQEPLVQWIRDGALDYKDYVTSEFNIRNIHGAFEETKKKTNTKTLLRFAD